MSFSYIYNTPKNEKKQLERILAKKGEKIRRILTFMDKMV